MMLLLLFGDSTVKTEVKTKLVFCVLLVVPAPFLPHHVPVASARGTLHISVCPLSALTPRELGTFLSANVSYNNPLCSSGDLKPVWR